MKKIYLGLMLALIAIILLSAAQAEVFYSGTFDNGGYWEVDENGVMTIEGEVNTYDLEVNGTDLQDVITKVVIGPDVEQLNFGTFSYSYSLTEFEVDPANENYASPESDYSSMRPNLPRSSAAATWDSQMQYLQPSALRAFAPASMPAAASAPIMSAAGPSANAMSSSIPSMRP